MSAILYVDDEPALCRAFERAVRAQGVRVVTTTSAQSALDMLTRETFDVVASDYRMPDLTGVDVLREARKHCPTARRLLVSGRIEGEVDVADLAEADVDCVLLKPWSLEDLRRVVRRALEHAQVSRERNRLAEALEQTQARLAEALSALGGRRAG